MKQRIQFSITLLLIALCSIAIAGVKNIAHRGGSFLAPENTLAAYNNAVALKADYLELDILISSDDSLMIMHDNTVDRTTNGTGTVSSMTYAQLRALDAGSKFNVSFAGEKIPTFSEVLEVAKNSANNIGIVAEIKSTDPTAVSKTVAMIQKYGMQSKVIVSSFDIAQITSVKSLDATIRVQLFATATNAIIDQVKGINGEWIGSSVGTQPLIDYAHSQGVLFNIWTINSASQMTSYIALGVDGITTDDPKTLKAVSDTTAPTDVTLISATANETKITLIWNAATDAEGGIVGYEIYRGTSTAPTVLYAAVGDTTQFIDQTYTENVTYYYRVKAKNVAQLLSANYSNEQSAITLPDVTKPLVSFVTSRGDTGTVVVEFSERVDSATASTKTNYTINKSVLVLNVAIALDQKSVILTTTKLNDLSYTMNVKNVKDKAIAGNVMVTSNNIFVHTTITSNVVADYKLDNIAVQGVDTLIFDATANANNGILKNGPVLSDGFLGNGLQFDGVDDFVQFSTSPSFDIGGSAVSVSVWAKLNFLPNELPGAFGPLFDSETDNYVLYEDKGNNQLRFKVTTSGGAARPAIPAADLKKGEWINVVGVYDGANAMVYLNGVLKGTLPLTGTVNAGQVATLGKSGTTYFSGKMDNVIVFNKALSSIEVSEMYNKAKTTVLSAQPSDVVLNSAMADQTNITLNWLAATNYESGLMYEIYRDVTPSPTTLIATVPGNVTSYVDKTNKESQTFYYRMKAKNSVVLRSANYSNEVSAATVLDATKPVVVYATSRGDSSNVIVEFNEMVDSATASTKTNYSINKSVQVLGAKLAVDGKSVIVTTTMLAETTYTLNVKNIKDKAATPNVMVTSNTIFFHKNSPAKLVARYKLDDVLNDTTIVDATTNGNNGTAKNGVTLSEGLLGNALRFDGVDDFVQFVSSPSFDIPGGLVSVSVWTKLDYMPAEMSFAFGPLFDSETDEYVLYADKGNKELRFKAVNTTGGAARPGIPEADLISGQWLNIVGVFDGANAMIYLNGVKKGVLPLTGTVKAGQIATLGKSGTNFFKGSIDNVEIFDKALSQAEVSEMFTNIKTAGLPAAPSDVVLNSATVDETNVTLQWQPAINYESAFMGYEIYRDNAVGATTLVATVNKNTTTYIDKTNIESQTLFYRIKAKNSVGLKSVNYSNEISATTKTDTQKPTVSYVTSRGDVSDVVVEFSEKVTQASAVTLTNYSFDNSVQVLGAKLGLDGKSVIVTTSQMTDSVVYALTIKGIKDRATTANTMFTTTVTFRHRHSRPNLVARYKLDEVMNDTVVVDATANGNNGATRNGVTLTEGISGNAFHFDGVDDFVQFASSPSFDIGGSAVSLSVWTKLDLLPAEAIQGTGPLFDSQGDEYVMYEDRGNKELRFKVTNATAGAARPGIPEADLISGQWIHCVGVYDGVNAVIYLNGVKKGSLALTGNVRTGQVAMLGRSATSGTTSYFQGAIDNVEVFNKALSQDEITDMYNTIKTSPLSLVITGISDEAMLPKVFSLSQNYPNPFNPTTNITFGVPQNSNVKIIIYDILGREVSTLVNENYSPGFYTIPFKGNALASGVYLYRMTSQSLNGNQKLFTNTKKFLLLK